MKFEHIFKYKPEFISLLTEIVKTKHLDNTYNLSPDMKYSINYIYNIIVACADQYSTRYILPVNLCKYFKLHKNSMINKTRIKNCIKHERLMILDDRFLKTYIVIGYDVPINMDKLDVFVE
jgi:hypothetical protein